MSKKEQRSEDVRTTASATLTPERRAILDGFTLEELQIAIEGRQVGELFDPFAEKRRS